jgi:hypothetical protein
VASNPTFTTPDEEDVLGCHDCDVADLCSGFVIDGCSFVQYSASAVIYVEVGEDNKRKLKRGGWHS